MDGLADTPADVVELARAAQTKGAIFKCAEIAKNPQICEN
jgi:hypothetical protein